MIFRSNENEQVIRLDYRRPFIDYQLYITNTIITTSLDSLLKQITDKAEKDRIIIVTYSTLENDWFNDIVNELLKFTSETYTITTNTDINFDAIPSRFIKLKQLTFFKGLFVKDNQRPKSLIHQVGFIYNSKEIVIGRSI